MTNLPPGVTDSMIPGNAIRPTWTLVPEDYTEVTLPEWIEWDVSEGESTCDRCSEVVGYYLGQSATNPDADAECWAPCWEVDENVVCDDCREALLAEADRAAAEADLVTPCQ